MTSPEDARDLKPSAHADARPSGARDAADSAVTSAAPTGITQEKVVAVASAAALPLDDWQSDAALRRLTNLDPTAWQELFDQYYKRMYNFAYVRTGDVQGAEDIAAEVFAAAARRIRSYRSTGAPIAAWLFRIARNITADYLERRRRRPVVDLEVVEVPATGWATGLEEKQDLMRAIARLSRDQQDVIALRFIDDCSLEETARVMGKSVGAVKVLQHRAIAALRRIMEVPASEGKRR